MELPTLPSLPPVVAGLVLLLFAGRLSPTISINISSHGCCHWTESCKSEWLGGCGAGYMIVDQSHDCKGHCPEPKYPTCPFFHTHFHCCRPEIPRKTERCIKCQNKVDFGDEYVCCTDCSDPHLVDKSRKIGYCKSGAELAVQLKTLETFKWVVGPWMKCSSPCDGGIRYRDVSCFGSSEDKSIVHHPVDDNRCSSEDMPARLEPCNMESCGDYISNNSKIDEQSGLSGWLISLFVLLGLAAVGGLSFAGYTYYKRRTSAPSGFVYITLEGYS